MQVLRPAMAAFIGEKAEYFKQFLTAEECERTAWNELLSDIRHLVGNAKRWGGDLEISDALFNTLPLAKVMNLRSLSQWNPMRVFMDGGESSKSKIT